MSIQDKQGNYQKYNSDGSTPVVVVGSLVTLRRVSTDPEPTTNDDGSALVKYQLLWLVDNDVFKYWNGTIWVVKE